MDIYQEYQKKLVSAEEAVKLVKDGDWVDYSCGVGAPTLLDDALAKRKGEVKDVKVGKFFDVTLDPSKKDIETAVKEVAEELLVNFNLETYHYEIMEEA